MAIEHYPSCGNVFADLSLPDPDLRLVKAEATIWMERLMEEEGLTQTAAAARMGITQPDLSTLLRGRTKGFSLDRIFRCLNALGVDVQINFAPAPAGAQVGEIVMLTAPESERVRVRGMAEEEEPERLAA